MRDTYDIVVIGGGHNGLTGALELANAGFTVLVLEARDVVGGCAATTEPLVPGYLHNPHANTLLFADLMPTAISPSTLGVRLHYPAAQLGIAFVDGRPPVILHRPDLLDSTRASLAVYSQADASVYADLKQRSSSLGPLLKQGLYAPPDPRWFETQRSAVQQAFAGYSRLNAFGLQSARAFIDDQFVSPEVRTLLYALAMETGVDLEETGGATAFLGYSLWLAGRWRICVGGMRSYVEALERAAVAAGVEIATANAVAALVSTAGRVRGIKTVGGKMINSSHAVLAATPILELYEHLLSPADMSSAERGELKAFKATRAASIMTSCFCLDRAPRYKSGVHDPAIDRCLKTLVGVDEPSDTISDAADVRAGRLPRPAGVVRVHSLWDASLSPAGRHIAAVDSNFPAESLIDAGSWGQIEAAFPTALFDVWSQYLSEPSPNPISMCGARTSNFERRMLLRMGSGQYRTHMKGLYLAGPGVYPGGGVHGACGHNAAHLITADLAR